MVYIFSWDAQALLHTRQGIIEHSRTEFGH